jgi:hypothetical protein
MSSEDFRITPDECVRNSDLYFGQAADCMNPDEAEHVVGTALDWQRLGVLIQSSLDHQESGQKQSEEI